MGGAPTPDRQSAEEQMAILEKESELASARDEEQRQFVMLQEEQRMAREEAQRLLTQQEEASRLSEIERLETAGAGVAETLVDPIDTDTSMADMFAALAFGTEFVGEGEAGPEGPPYPE